jgi:hypothetical protein
LLLLDDVSDLLDDVSELLNVISELVDDTKSIDGNETGLELFEAIKI